MRLPSPHRLAAAGLAIAAVTILALSALAWSELDREAELHREVLAAGLVKDSLEALRIQVIELANAGRLAAVAGSDAASQAIERRAVEIDAEIGYLAQHPSRDDRSDAFAELASSARALVVNARSVAVPGRAGVAVAELERAARQANLSLARNLERQRERVNERTLAKLRAGETLRSYVAWLVAGSIVVLLGLFGFYRWARSREDANARRIEHLAHFDLLTGLPNRALLADRLDNEIARARRGERGFALLMFDIDGFKDVNDRWGHAAGDRVLVSVATRARGAVRASDTVGRVGGDEFLAILPESSLEGALAVAEKLREVLAQPHQLGNAQAWVAASIGVGLYPQHGTDAQTLQRAADDALYVAKRAGKNRVEVAAAGASEPREAAATVSA